MKNILRYFMQLLMGGCTCPEGVHKQSVLKIKQLVLCLILLLCYNININTVNTVSTAFFFLSS